jgi:hypothetical protein
MNTKTKDNGTRYLGVLRLLVLLGAFAIVIQLVIFGYHSVRYVSHSQENLHVPIDSPWPVQGNTKDVAITKKYIALSYLFDNADTSTYDNFSREKATAHSPHETINYQAKTTSTLDRVLVIFPYLLAGVVMLFSLWLVYQMIKSAIEQNPFSFDNVKRLRILGAIAILWPLFYSLVQGSILTRLMEKTPSYGSGPFSNPTVLQINIGIALLIFALSEIFSRGVQLQANEDLTV